MAVAVKHCESNRLYPVFKIGGYSPDLVTGPLTVLEKITIIYCNLKKQRYNYCLLIWAYKPHYLEAVL